MSLSKMFIKSVLFVASLQYIVAANNCQVSHNGNDSESLEHYISNNVKYFISNSQLQFKSRECYLTSDLVIQNINNFSLIGESSCKVTCASYVSILIFNVTHFKLENINFVNCNKNYSHNLNISFDYDHVIISKPSRNGSILLYNCTSVVINNISVLVNAGTTGIFAVNVRSNLTLTNISITVNYTICPTEYEHQEQINGILFYYDHYNNKSTNIQINSFHYTGKGSCAHSLQYAITLLLFQKNANVSFNVNNTNFSNLINVSLIYYYGETCGIFVRNVLQLTNCILSNNTGFSNFKMVEIILYNKGCFDAALLEQYCNQQYNRITFVNCKFVGNQNITSMIYVTPASSRGVTGYINVINSSFCSNYNTHFLNLESDTDNVWQLSNYITIEATTISSNRHLDGKNLISATNCWMKFIGSTFITNNSLYKSIIKLHLSGATFQYNITITANVARQIFYGSYILLLQNTTVNVSFNTVYIVVRQTFTMDISSKPVCGIQFYSLNGTLDKIDDTKWPYKVIIINNTHMTPKTLLYRTLYNNCQWLAGTAFHTRAPKEVYDKLFQFHTHNLVIETEKERPIPLNICKCNITAFSANCRSTYLGSIFPGETLTTQLHVQEDWMNFHNSSSSIIVKNSISDDCSIVHTSELSQTHFNIINYCNNYNYTLWPKNATIKKCQLFIGLNDMPEMFNVDIKPCPKGFTFQEPRKACYCDPLLNNKLFSISSCDIKNEAILRPANSWIIAETDQNSHVHEYQVSLRCPFAFCLPESSHLNLSNPDSQCQFNRTGLLCGNCKPGLSVVLGTPQCKPCSDIYLLLLIPIIISGIALVIVFYAFNLTVRDGTINTLIFYVNIININILTLFPGCQSIICILLSQLNFNFRTNTCFYNGMDDYAKEWLNLLHPFFFIIIAVSFIALSRYSPAIQRLTAQKALPVLATLVLFSYTKVLLSVCHVLFHYSTITHLPSNKTEVFWSVSTTTPLFGVRFFALFIVCVILFVILIPFNIILLFARRLSFINLVMKLKPLLDTYFSAYKDEAYYWTGLLLLIRIIVYVLSAFGNDISFITTSILFGGLLCLHGIVQPFKNKFHNTQESIAIAILLAAHVAPLYKPHSIGQKVAHILLVIGTLNLILVILFCYCKQRYKRKFLKYMTWLQGKIKEDSRSEFSAEMNSLSDRIADVTYNYKEFQEPLVQYET